MDLSDEEIMARVIHKLYRRGNWGESHTSFENLKKATRGILARKV